MDIFAQKLAELNLAPRFASVSRFSGACERLFVGPPMTVTETCVVRDMLKYPADRLHDGIVVFACHMRAP